MYVTCGGRRIQGSIGTQSCCMHRRMEGLYVSLGMCVHYPGPARLFSVLRVIHRERRQIMETTQTQDKRHTLLEAVPHSLTASCHLQTQQPWAFMYLRCCATRYSGLCRAWSCVSCICLQPVHPRITSLPTFLHSITGTKNWPDTAAAAAVNEVQTLLFVPHLPGA